MKHPTFPKPLSRVHPLLFIALAAAASLVADAAAPKQSPEERAAAAAKAAQQLQATLFGMADRFVQGYGEILTEAVTRETPPEIRLAAQLEKVHAASAVYSLAASNNPESSLIDLMVLATVRRMASEAGAAEKMFGKQTAARLIAFSRKAEEEMWAAGTKTYLSADQVAELRALAETWHRENADLRYTSLVHFHEFLLERSKGGLAEVVRGNRGMLGPLRDAVAALDDVKLVTDRAMFLSVRLPLLMRWQVEALGYNMLSLPEARQVLASTSELTEAATKLSTQIDTLPAEITKQREAFFASVQDNLGGIGKVLQQTQDALLVADKALVRVENVGALVKDTSSNIDSTAQHIDSLMKSFSASSSGDESESFKPEEILKALADARAIADTMLQLTLSAERMAGDPKAGAPPVVQATLHETEMSLKRIIDRATLRAVEVLAAFTLVWIAFAVWRGRRQKA